VNDSREIIYQGAHGRDAGKAFKVEEISPVQTAAYVLRILAALRLSDQADLLELFQPAANNDEAKEGILRVLTGCDPERMHGLITDALTHVQVAPDPQHPGLFRPVQVADIREMRTLGDLLGTFARVNLMQQD